MLEGNQSPKGIPMEENGRMLSDLENKSNVVMSLCLMVDDVDITMEELYTTDENVSKEQLEIRFKRYQMDIAIIKELLSKVSLSVSRLEEENCSHREQKEYYKYRCGLSERIPTIGTEKLPTAPSAARIACELSLANIERMQEKMRNFGENALKEKILLEETKQENKLIKATLEEVTKNLEEAKKNNEFLEERITFMQNEYVEEVTRKLIVERRCRSLEKQVSELSETLLAQQNILMAGRNEQHLVSTGTELLPVCEVVITSTPETPRSQRPTASAYFGQIALKEKAPKLTTRLHNVFLGVEDRFHKFRNKIKTFVERKTSFLMVQGTIMDQTRFMLKCR